MFYFDPVYLLFIAPGLLIGLFATVLLKYWGSKYKSLQNLNHITGAELVSKISQKYGLKLSMNIIDQEYGDYYNPSENSLTLSRQTAYGTTITAVAVAGHELGHALQHKNHSPLIYIREFIVPAVNIGTNLGYILIVIGLVMSIFELSYAGLILFSISTIFTLVTLPIEIDASRRALNFINSSDILFPEEISGAKKVLSAAALTYVAALLQSVGQLLYFFFRIKKKN